VSGWNFAAVWETVADLLPGAPALVHGDRHRTWDEFDRRADGIAAHLLAAGVQQGDKVAEYLWNGPEYLEAVFATFKIGLVPVNTNYRYGEDELAYLWDNGDVVAVVFHGEFTERIDHIRERVPRVRTWLWVDDGTGPCPDWAVAYEDAAASAPARVAAPWGRDGDDLYLMYTGGTTGMPKGVMWRQDDLFVVLNAASPRRYGQDASFDRVRELVTRPAPVFVPACPLMHGTGSFNAMMMLSIGGSVVTLEAHHFDVVELMDTIEREGVGSIAIVGDAFAKPMLRALDADPRRWDLARLRVVFSSGVMFSEPVKQGLLRHLPKTMLVDLFGSSEALGLGSSVSSRGRAAATARFSLGANARVIDDDGHDVVPGSGVRGRVALRGRTPLGYYKDPEKSAGTFVVLDGVRYAIPGDYALVEADGTLTLLGRGSVCINTGGEKVFPEEVEEVLKEHPAIHDAAVVGVPDERFGEAITAIVEPEPQAEVDEAQVIAYVKAHLAHFKAPKRVLIVGSIGRAANGKLDYNRWKAFAAETVGTPS
jgi:fatty-acyl-CoA synthase